MAGIDAAGQQTRNALRREQTKGVRAQNALNQFVKFRSLEILNPSGTIVRSGHSFAGFYLKSCQNLGQPANRERNFCP